MSINLMCTKCLKTHKLSTKKCKCGSYLKRSPKYRVRVRTDTGWKTKTADTLADAKRFKKCLLKGIPIVADVTIKPKRSYTEVSSGNDLPSTVDDTFSLYIEWAKIHKRSWDMDQSRYKNFIKRPLGHLQMESIKPFQIQRDILNKMHKRGYAPATVKQVLLLIKRLYNWSREQGIHESAYNPCNNLKVPKVDNRVTNPIATKEQLKRLEDVLDGWSYNKMVPLIIRFALYTGRRKGEILALKWRDVDLVKKFVTITKAKNGMIQTYPINRKAMSIIMRAKVLKRGRCPYVFPNRNGNSYHHSGGFDKTWRLIRKKAGLPTTRFHDLRHTFASWIASSGKVDIYTLKELLGHSDIKMTQRYAHLINGALRRAVEVADEVF